MFVAGPLGVALKTLLLVRHAKSSWEEPSLGDRERPLNGRGRRDAPRMGALLRRLGQCPERILSSDAVRARATALTMAEAAGFSGSIQFLRDLYEASPAGVLEAAARTDEPTTRLMIVGHNPGLEALVGRFVGQDLHFPTAAIAIIDLPIAAWRELGPATVARAAKVVRPKDLRADGSGLGP
ncbi:MAG: histidine phosphatase family protein [Myxococcota bacterium]